MLQYRDQLDLTLWRRCMDRSGGSLMSAGDQDIANTACDMGMEMGVFPSLRLDHLIPPERMIEAYLLRLATAAEFSNHMLRWCRDPEFPAPTLSPRRFIRYLRNCVSRRGQDRRFYLARVRGERAAAKFHRSLARDAGQEAEDFIRNQRFMGENVGGLNSKHERKKSFT